MQNEKIIVEEAFLSYFKKPLKPFAEVAQLFKDEAAYIKYLKKALYFTKAVIEPLGKKGMRADDAILDLASGDGQMSLALALLGYHRIILFDMDEKRLGFAKRVIQAFVPGMEVRAICASATELEGSFDVLICYQTIEHLSDEGNYSIAKRACQVEFLRRVNRSITKLCYFNAPNWSFPIDGHDTGKPFFHWLPMPVKKFLIGKKYIKCSWPGICVPVSVSFLERHLDQFKLASRYHAHDSMKEHLASRAPFDYMGGLIPAWDGGPLPWKKKLFGGLARLMGARVQNLMPVLSLVLEHRAAQDSQA